MLVFCKENFKKNAEPHIRRSVPKEHLEILDGMDVDYESNKWGIISLYNVPGDEDTNWYLTPVPEEWCRKEKQLTLF